VVSGGCPAVVDNGDSVVTGDSEVVTVGSGTVEGGSVEGVYSCSVESGDPAVDTVGCCVVEGIEGSVEGEVSSAVVVGSVVGEVGSSVVSGGCSVVSDCCSVVSSTLINLIGSALSEE
jgi:hypothetical protein